MFVTTIVNDIEGNTSEVSETNDITLVEWISKEEFIDVEDVEECLDRGLDQYGLGWYSDDRNKEITVYGEESTITYKVS